MPDKTSISNILKMAKNVHEQQGGNMFTKILNFLEGIKWWILLAIAIVGFGYIYWGRR